MRSIYYIHVLNEEKLLTVHLNQYTGTHNKTLINISLFIMGKMKIKYM